MVKFKLIVMLGSDLSVSLPWVTRHKAYEHMNEESAGTYFISTIIGHEGELGHLTVDSSSQVAQQHACCKQPVALQPCIALWH